MGSVKPLIVFDMDGVLVKDRSSWRTIHRTLGTDNEDSFRAYMQGEIDDLEFMRRDIERWLKADPTLDRKRMLEIYSGVERMKGFRETFRELSRSKTEVVIISGGMDLLAEELVEEAGSGIPIANGVEFDKVGRLTGAGILRVPLRDKGSVLSRIMNEYDQRGPVISVGDSVVDLTMFRISDLSIAFRPESNEVRSSADISVEGDDLREVLTIIYGFLR